MKLFNKKAFTLIEIIISIALLGIIAIFILPMSMYGVKYSKWNNIKLNALNLAHTQIEWIKTYDYDELDNIDGGKYLNEENTVRIDNIEYKVFTNIYWIEDISITGEPVLDANRGVDVVVRAKDLFSGKEKEYSILRTLITRESEKDVSEPGLKVITYLRDNENLADRVKVKLNTGEIIQSNLDGRAIFAGLDEASYTAEPISWKGNEIMGKPLAIDNTRIPKWIYSKEATLDKWTSDKGQEFHYPEISFIIDLPGYINLPENNNYPKNVSIKIGPNEDSYNPPEGEANDHLFLNTKLTELEGLKFWRLWKYEYNIKNGEEEYFFINREEGNLWDGTFKANDLNKASYENLELGFALKNNEEEYGEFVLESGKIKEIKIKFTSEIINIEDIQFTLNDIPIENKEYKTHKDEDNNKDLIIEFSPGLDIIGLGDEMDFEIINSKTIVNKFGMGLVEDLNKSRLYRKR